MKRCWIYVVVALFLLAALPVSAETNQPAVTLTVEDVTVTPGTDMVDVYFYYDTAEYLLDGSFFVTFPADKVMPEFGGPISPTNPDEKYCLLPWGMMNINHLEEGYFRMSFVDATSFSVTGEGQVAKISFRILDPSVEGSYPIHFYADRLVKWVEGNAVGQNLVSEETPIEDIGYITVTAQTTTSVVTTEPPTTSTTQTTTVTPTTRETTATSTVTTIGSETCTTTGQLPAGGQPEEKVEPQEASDFPWWILFVAAVVGTAILIPVAIKLRKK